MYQDSIEAHPLREKKLKKEIIDAWVEEWRRMNLSKPTERSIIADITALLLVLKEALHPKSTGLADEGELGFMKSVEAQFEKIVVAKAKGAGEQTANLAIDSFHLSAGQTGVVKA